MFNCNFDCLTVSWLCHDQDGGREFGLIGLQQHPRLIHSFSEFIHAQKRDPKTHSKDADMFWDTSPKTQSRSPPGHGPRNPRRIPSLAWLLPSHFQVCQGGRLVPLRPDPRSRRQGLQDYGIQALFEDFQEGQLALGRLCPNHDTPTSRGLPLQHPRPLVRSRLPAPPHRARASLSDPHLICLLQNPEFDPTFTIFLSDHRIRNTAFTWSLAKTRTKINVFVVLNKRS